MLILNKGTIFNQIIIYCVNVETVFVINYNFEL